MHTPGPWFAIGTRVSANAGGEPLSIADFDMDTRIDHDTTACANATLGAAAPEMLEALKTLVAMWEDAMEHQVEGWERGVSDVEIRPDGLYKLSNARAAIAKAEGRS